MTTQITIHIHRVQATTITVEDDFDPTGDIDAQLDAHNAWDALSARLHEDTHILAITARPVPEPVPVNDDPGV